jgi:hypothetical protein
MQIINTLVSQVDGRLELERGAGGRGTAFLLIFNEIPLKKRN